MNPAIEPFRRQFRKVQRVGHNLVRRDAFGLECSWDGRETFAQITNFDETDAVRLAVLMRPFLDPSHALHYQKLWAVLIAELSDWIISDEISMVTKSMSQLAATSLQVVVNDEVMNAEQIYRRVADGDFFSDKEDAARFLREIANIPLFGTLLLQQFYVYTLKGFLLVSDMFALTQRAVKARAATQPLDSVAVIVNKCIYCLWTSGHFTSEEHIFSEQLGNTELILPRGRVCDDCNNGVLSRLDKHLAELPSIALARLQYVPFTKAGKMQRAEFRHGTIVKVRPRHLRLEQAVGRSEFVSMQEMPDGWTRLDLNIEGKNKFDPKKIARAVCKIGLGLLALEEGHEAVCNAKYDAVRDFILGKASQFPGNLLMAILPRTDMRVVARLEKSASGTVFSTSIFGTLFWVNLEETPRLIPDEAGPLADIVQVYSLGK